MLKYKTRLEFGERERERKMGKEKRKWDGRLIKKDEGGGAKPPDPDSFLDEELAILLRTALAKTSTKRSNEHKNIPLELLLVLRKKKIPVNAIARICKCSPSNIRKRLQGKLQDIRMVDQYKENRADILAYQQRRVLTSITDKDLEEADLKDKSISYGILYDKERLETGKGIGGGNLIVMVTNFGSPQESPIDV